MKLLNKIKITLIIIFFISIVLASKSFAITGIITEITVNLREKPSTDSKKIMYVTQDDKVEVLEKDGEWYKIKAKGKTGYVFGEYIKVDDSKLEQKEETTTKTENVQTTTKNEETQEIEGEETNKEVAPNTNLIIKNKTQIRIVPNITSSVIYTASKDTQVNIIEQINDWSYVSVNNVTGWLRTDNIVEKNEVLPDEKEVEEKREQNKTSNTIKKETPELKTSYIKYDNVNLRQKASTSSKTLAKLKLNDEVQVIEKINDKWSKVQIEGKTGYISNELLSDKKQDIKESESKKDENNTTSRDGEATSRQETTDKKIEVDNTKNEEAVKNNATNQKENIEQENATSSKGKNKETTSNKVTGEDIVAYAKKYLGYKYVYGGATPKTGFDCSGFTYYVYKHFGYTLSRSSKAQANNGTKVDKEDLKPGDLVIYKNNSLTAIGHVGIYIGNNKMIHASEPGVGVVITDIDSKAHKYPQRYVMGRRIIK